MKKNLIIILFILFVPMFLYMGLSNFNSPVAKGIKGNQDKPQIIKFTSSMCLDCQTMNKLIKEVYPTYKDKIILTEVHVQDRNSFTNSQLKKYNVVLVPTIIFINSDGKQVKRIEGAIEKQELIKYIEGLK